MSRRNSAEIRDVLPDPVYGSKVVTKLVNNIMQDGKRTIAQTIVYDAMNIASEKASRVMEVMIPKVKPLTMMYAKILAVVSTALLQLVVLACGYLIPYLLGWVDLESASLFGIPIDFTKLDAKVISMFLVYFI